MLNSLAILTLAAAQIGTKESPPDSNDVKYNTAYYGREVSGNAYSWCCVFLWWCFREAGAGGLFYGGGKTASCTALYNHYKRCGQVVTDYQPGDLVFFNFEGKQNIVHIGVVERVNGDGSLVTIEGNTGSGNDANGGAVMRRTRSLKLVVGGARPKYEQKEEIDVTEEQVRTIVTEAVAAALAAQKPKVYAALAEVPVWAQDTVKRAMDCGALHGDEGGKLRLTDDNLVILQVLGNLGLMK